MTPEGPTESTTRVIQPLLPPIPLPATAAKKPLRKLVVTNEEDGIAYIINKILEHSGNTQASACKLLGIHVTTMQQYRTGRHIQPSVWWLNRLVQACGARLVVEFFPKDIED